MASATFLPLLLLLAITASSATTADLRILHGYSGKPPAASPLDTLLLLARRDASRFAFLASLRQGKSDVPVASGQQATQSPSYVLRASLGSPPQSLLMVLDTSADLSFFPAATTSNSSTFSPLPCSSPLCPSSASPSCPATCTLSQPYGSDSFTAALASDTLTLPARAVPGFTFASVASVAGPGTSFPKQGLLGLGRGPASLLSQTQTLFSGVFSYCLPSFSSYYFTGSLRLGPAGQPARIPTTPLLRNPRRSSLYYVNLTGISVGRTLLQFPPGCLAFDPATGAGTVVDSGTVISRFIEPVYTALRDEFRRQVGAPEYTSLGAFDTCFPTTAGGPATPGVTLHLAGLELALPVENTLIHSSGRPLACLAMAASPGNVNAVLNIVGALQQQNHRVVFDVANARVGFARELCN